MKFFRLKNKYFNSVPVLSTSGNNACKNIHESSRDYHGQPMIGSSTCLLHIKKVQRHFSVSLMTRL